MPRLRPLLLALAATAALANPSAADEVCVRERDGALARTLAANVSALRDLAQFRSVRVVEPLRPGHVDDDRRRAERFERDVRAYLGGGGAAFLLYAGQPGEGCAFLWTSEGGRAYAQLSRPLTSASEVAGRLAQFAEHKARVRGRTAKPRGMTPAEDAPAPGDPQDLIAELGAALLPPAIRHQLRGVADLTIFAPGELGSVPFAALPVGGEQRLGERFAIYLLPFLADVSRTIPDVARPSWADKTLRWSPGFDDVVIVGDPEVRNDPSFSFPPLPGARAEARYAKTVLGGRLYEGARASKQIVAAAVAGADFLYFAGHAVSDESDPLDRSFLAVRGRLTAREIQNVRASKPSVVVLSACQTGAGRALGAGIVGLARAFGKAGAVSVIMSLWSVDDAATEALMRSFIDRLAQEPPAAALRTAIVEARAAGIDLLDRSAFQVFGPRVRTR